MKIETRMTVYFLSDVKLIDKVAKYDLLKV
jgi:hypothetical protein